MLSALLLRFSMLPAIMVANSLDTQGNSDQSIYQSTGISGARGRARDGITQWPTKLNMALQSRWEVIPPKYRREPAIPPDHPISDEVDGSHPPTLLRNDCGEGK
ncbi:hypothetical protein KC333_g100 [Hortaea werneckii]|nr:hypothetical protein KC333_g100 [Hortaea werneckii]